MRPTRGRDLFNDHRVDERDGNWIYRECVSSYEARAVEDYFVQKGMKGGPWRRRFEQSVRVRV